MFNKTGQKLNYYQKFNGASEHAKTTLPFVIVGLLIFFGLLACNSQKKKIDKIAKIVEETCRDVKSLNKIVKDKEMK